MTRATNATKITNHDKRTKNDNGKGNGRSVDRRAGLEQLACVLYAHWCGSGKHNKTDEVHINSVRFSEQKKDRLALDT